MIFKVEIEHYNSHYNWETTRIIEASSSSEIEEGLEKLYKEGVPDTHPFASHCRYGVGGHDHLVRVTGIHPDSEFKNGELISLAA